MTFSSKLNTVLASSSFSMKERIQKLVFPEGVVYDMENEAFRTSNMNFIFQQIACLSNDCEVEQK